MKRRVVITGLGVVSAAGVGTDAFWRGLTSGGAGLQAAPPELAAIGVHVVGAVRDFSGAGYLKNERNARVLNRSFELLVGAGALAAADAALGPRPIAPPRLGVIVGIGPIEQHTPDLVGAIREATKGGAPDLAKFAESSRHLHPLRRLRVLPNVGPAILSIEHKAMGPSLTLVSGHATGLQAVSEGLAMIRDGRVDAVLCGGTDSRLTPIALRAFAELCPLSPSRDPRDGVPAVRSAARRRRAGRRRRRCCCSNRRTRRVRAPSRRTPKSWRRRRPDRPRAAAPSRCGARFTPPGG